MATIYALIRDDHNRLRKILDELDETSGDSEERRDLFETMKRELDAHNPAEEETFYATLLASPKGQKRARHSISEHKEADDQLTRLDESDFSSPGWITKFRKLKQALEHHMEEEEGEVFDTARQIIPDDQAEAIGAAFEERKGTREAA